MRWNELNIDLRKFIARKVVNHADAEDILQEVLLKIHRSAERLPKDANLFAWIYTIARNSITDHYRKPSPPISLDTANDAPLDIPEELLSRDALNELATCLQPFVDHVPEKYREALVRIDLEGMPQAELARKLGLSLSGAKSRVQRAREMLKGKLLDCCQIEYNGAGRVVDYKCRNPEGCEPQTTPSVAGAEAPCHSGRK